MTIDFTPPAAPTATGDHHAAAAAGNDRGSARRRRRRSPRRSTAPPRSTGSCSRPRPAPASRTRSSGSSPRRSTTTGCDRVAVIAFTNKQLHPLAESLGKALGRDKVCLFVKDTTIPDLPDGSRRQRHGRQHGRRRSRRTTKVLIATSHKLGAINELNRQKNAIGHGRNGTSVYDVLFVDEAWQLPHHLFDKVTKAAPIWVGVGDVGQLPPLEIGANPWRGEPGYNPYRAWPTDYTDGKDDRTWERELPAVWRPAAGPPRSLARLLPGVGGAQLRGRTRRPRA